jgi:predicted PurR-regulated permease PerM
MIFRRIKKTVTTLQQRRKRLEKDKEKQLDHIEKMYANLESKDAQLQERERKLPQFGTNFVLKFWILWALVAYFSYIIFKTLDVVYLILAAFVISMIMDAPISFFSKRMPRGLAIALAYLIILGFLFVIVVVILPFVFNQLAEVLKIALERINEFQALLQSQWLPTVIEKHTSLPSSVKNYILDNIKSDEFISTLQSNLQQNISQIVTTGTSYATDLWGFAVRLVTGIFTTVAQAMILFVMAIFFSIEKEWVIHFIASLAGSRKNHMYVKMQKMYAKLGLRLKWQTFVCIYVGVMVALLFALSSWIFNVTIPNISTLWVIAGLMNFIPYIWPLIWMIIAILVTLIAWWWKAGVLVAIVYALVNQSENNVLTPIIMNKTLGVSALLIFICMLMGGLVFGFMWVLLAVPISVILTMAFDKEEE